MGSPSGRHELARHLVFGKPPSIEHGRLKYRLSEAQITAEFYMAARLAGLEVYLEVAMPSPIHRSREMRVDAVVVGGSRVVCCVEVKSGALPQTSTRQMAAYEFLYRDHGIQTFWLNDLAAIPGLVQQIKALHSPRRIAQKEAAA